MKTSMKGNGVFALAWLAMARFCCVAIVAAMVSTSLLGQEASLALRRAEHLRHGINLSEWFA